jgi:hypothetical protein
MHRKPAGIQKVVVLGRDAGRVERRMLQQPDHLIRLAGRNGGDARLHESLRGRVVDVAGRHGPFDRSAIVETQFLKGRA